VTEQRYRAVLEVRAGVPVTEGAERYGVSRQSVHVWLRRYRDEGPSGLADRSHRVRHHPWQIAAELESAICELRRAHPRWGPERLVFEMGRRGHGNVTRSTVYRVLVRNGLVKPKSRRRRRQDYKRWERPVPMQLWQLDVTASAFLASGREVKIVTGIDDHSRFCVIAKAVLRATARPACRAFVDAMGVYGVPEELLSDNVTVFTGRFIKPRPAEVLFERICRENCITQRLTRPASPTTTGKIERLHQSLQAALDARRQDYNSDRPHRSLAMAFRASRFTPAAPGALGLRVPAGKPPEQMTSWAAPKAKTRPGSKSILTRKRLRGRSADTGKSCRRADLAHDHGVSLASVPSGKHQPVAHILTYVGTTCRQHARCNWHASWGLDQLLLRQYSNAVNFWCVFTGSLELHGLPGLAVWHPCIANLADFPSGSRLLQRLTY
jgi:transposase InsO family protein